MKPPCSECAFSKQGAGCEPYNALRARICVLGAIPFGCHHGQPWQNSSSWSAEQVKNALRTTGICEGWRAEIRRFNAKGFYGEYRAIRRAIAKQALFFVELLVAAKERKAKKHYLTRLGAMMRFLVSKDIAHKKLPL